LRKTFEYGTWGGELRREFAPQPGDVVALEHWCSSGFANTDLDLQLKKHGIHQLIVIGLIAHTCVEATVRCAAELGYDVTLVKDATPDHSVVEMHAALDVNLFTLWTREGARRTEWVAAFQSSNRGSSKHGLDIVPQRVVVAHISARLDGLSAPDGQRLDRETATAPAAMNNRSTASCAMPKGGSDCVGARSCKAGTFMNNCTTSTNTLKYSASTAQMM